MKDMKKVLLLLCIALLLCQAGCTRVPQDKEYVILKTIEENPEEYYSIFGLNTGLGADPSVRKGRHGTGNQHRKEGGSCRIRDEKRLFKSSGRMGRRHEAELVL